MKVILVLRLSYFTDDRSSQNTAFGNRLDCLGDLLRREDEGEAGVAFAERSEAAAGGRDDPGALDEVEAEGHAEALVGAVGGDIGVVVSRRHRRPDS